MPPSLADVAAGEVVLVEYGRRQAVGLVVDDGRAPRRETKPILARVRSDGPLLGPTQLALARHIAEHYLAPPALVVRQMLPPGMLERVELVARAVAPSAADGGELLAAVRAGGEAGVPVEDLPASPNRATRLRRLRELEAAGAVSLAWVLRPPGARRRVERIASLTEAGRAAASVTQGAAVSATERRPATGTPTGGRPLGPRQRALLEELAAAPDLAVPAAPFARRYGASAVTGLARRGLIELGVGVRERRPLASRAAPSRGALPDGADHTAPQREIVDRIAAAVASERHEAFLVDGVTAGGKTAVYTAAIEGALRLGRGAILLVPEIPLAVPLVDRLRYDLGHDVALLHSGLGEGERADEWRRVRADEARVVVGTRSAVLAPVSRLGVVVVDEEHDPAYKSDRTPRYQARDVALELGRIAGCPVVLGSATPDVVTVGRARSGAIVHLTLPDRARGRRPAVEVVDLREELRRGNRGLLSSRLVSALRALDRDAGERAILAINRRGSASVVLCRDCGHVQVCPECQRPLVYHATGILLRCHHCGATAPVARRCPACESPRIRYLGGGTEKVEREVRMRFPDLRVGRLDRDVSERKGAAAKVVDDFTEGLLDVLVGTSLVTKGLDVPEVTLVGVVSADIALNLPDERAAERTYQLLAQAVGRAGRGTRPGLAVIQTYQPEHGAIRAAATGDGAPFYEAELDARQAFGSPPFGALIKLTVADADRETAGRLAAEMAARLRERSERAGGGVTVLGPVPAYIARRGGRWRFHVVLRGDDPAGVLDGDPGAPWSVDVDPETLL